jgi:hypothetical protein
LLNNRSAFAFVEWHDKYQKALRQRELGKKEYIRQYTIPYLGGKVGIAAMVCWAITITLASAEYVTKLSASIPDLEFPALLATFRIPASVLTMIVLFREQY